MSIGVAILGGGIFAREEHLPAVNASEHLTLKAVWSRSLKSAQTVTTESSVDLYSEDSGDGKKLDSLLARSDIHAVIIALTIKGQPEYIKKAILAGKHVLSEKPIAENLEIAQGLIKWYKENGRGVHWSVAENNRYLNSLEYGRQQVLKIGRILTVRMTFYRLIKGGKYFETPWRKVPEYQGGFLLDGGVHWTASLRYVLGTDVITQISAFSAQLQSHLPPVDTLDASFKLKSGGTGCLSLSFGTTAPAETSYVIAGEKGSVTIDTYKSVTATDLEGKSVTKEISDERTGVPPEIRAWGEALASGRANKEQSPEEALADLELVRKMTDPLRVVV